MKAILVGLGGRGSSGQRCESDGDEHIVRSSYLFPYEHELAVDDRSRVGGKCVA